MIAHDVDRSYQRRTDAFTDEIKRLLANLHKLVNAGNIVVIEHTLDVIKSPDWTVDLGPESDPTGGHIVAEGRP